jgi:hypothetical protein
MRTDDPALLRAAIEWDRPVLLGSGHPGARSFVQVLDHLALERVFDEEPHGSAGALALAARGLAAELNGNVRTANDAYEDLASSNDTLVSLLGLLLLAWMEKADTDDMDKVAALLKSGAVEQRIAARCHTKLMTWAVDRGWREYAAERYADAIASAEGDLLTVLHALSPWFRDEHVLVDRVHEATVTYPWVRGHLDYATGEALQQAVRDAARHASSRTRTLGSGTGFSAQVAELQASWAGALWLLPEIWNRRGAILIMGSRSLEELTQGLALWVLGGGKDPERVIDNEEARFTEATATQIVVDHLKQGRRVRDLSTYVSACLALWDELAESVLEDIVREIPLRDSSDTFDPVFRLFAALAVRTPQLWSQRFQELSDSAKLQAAANLTPAASSYLYDETRDYVLDIVTKALTGNPEFGANNPNTWLLASTLLADARVRERKHGTEVAQLLAAMPDYLVPVASRLAPTLIHGQRLQLATAALSSLIQDDLAGAAAGRYAGRLFDARNRYAMALVAAGEASSEQMDVLIRAALDPSSDTEQRLGALGGIRMLIEAKLMPSERARSVLDPLPTGIWFWDQGEPGELVRASQLAIAVLLEESPDVDGDLLAASRSRDAEVRVLAVQAACAASRSRSSSALDATQLGALYDPDTAVQLQGVAALAMDTIRDQSLRRAARERVMSMWYLSHRDVRQGVARAAREWMKRDSKDRIADQLLSAARKDRSWLVRRVASDY